MRPDQRIVTQLPLSELWDDAGLLPHTRGQLVGRHKIAELLGTRPIQFFVANVGHPLDRVPFEDCYRYWKQDVKARLVEPAAAERGFHPEHFPGGYCFIGTEWGAVGHEPVVLLETFH
jgi:hypothetical protein